MGRRLPKRTCPRCSRQVSILSNVTRNKLRAHNCIRNTPEVVVKEKLCENCEESIARYWRSVTDADGVLLSREALCYDCAGGVGTIGSHLDNDGRLRPAIEE